jgi:ribosomal protein S27E
MTEGKFYRTTITCPNCLKAKVLHDTRDNQTYCDNCGQEYILVDKNTLRYK